jgi:hypothetical protein
MPLKTPFRLVIDFITILTTRNYNHLFHSYTFIELTILTRRYSILSVRSVCHSHEILRKLTAS